MAFPSSPANGQIAVVNNIAYVYNATLVAWFRNTLTSANVITTDTANIVSTISSTSTTTGALKVAGSAGTTNTGGGRSPGEYAGGNGGSGVVIIRYPSIYPAAASTTGSPSVTVTDVYRIYQWTTVGSGSITY